MCLPGGGVCLGVVSAWGWCLPGGGVCLGGVEGVKGRNNCPWGCLHGGGDVCLGVSA